jgi:hypothetical protein
MIASWADGTPAPTAQPRTAQGFSPEHRSLTGREHRLVPKGLTDSGRGFNPWEDIHTTARSEGAKEVRDRWIEWSTSAYLKQRFCRPLRGGAFYDQHHGLKPLAESFSPFGTKRSSILSTTQARPCRRVALHQKGSAKSDNKKDETGEANRTLCIGLPRNLDNSTLSER